MNREYQITYRAVRFKLDDNHYEVLVTNLFDEFNLEDFKELYHKRWEIETAFKYLKYDIGSIYFHSKNRQLIYQEIHASILMFNFCSIVAENIDIGEKKKTGKYKMKISLTQVITNVRMYIKGNLFEKNLIKNIKNFLVPERPERKFKRAMKPKSAISLNHRIS